MNRNQLEQQSSNNISTPCSESPVSAIDASDPGDQTQRNFRYQHAYGVILLVASIKGDCPYSAIWCEQHEDFLCERLDGLFDGYQIKTQRPEDGPWKLSTEGLYKSIKRFTSLYCRFPSYIGDLYFVSNTELFTTASAKDLHNSLPLLLTQMETDGSLAALSKPFDRAFKELQERISCDDESLWIVLQKIKLVKGPGRDEFDAVIAHDHIPTLSGCEHLSPADLNTLRDELVSIVFRASSLQTDDPSRHYYCLSYMGHKDPQLSRKRITIETVNDIIVDRKPITFRYLPLEQPMDLVAASSNPLVLERKLIKGGLADHVETMRRRALSAENYLMELAHRKPENIDEILNQVEITVKGECDDAMLDAQLKGEPYGRCMLNDVHQRLKAIADNHPLRVYNLQHDCLDGIVGILTAECQVWWSEHFDLEEM